MIRAWTEAGVSGFRARVTARLDLDGDEVTTRAVGDVDAACEAVQVWLERLLAS